MESPTTFNFDFAAGLKGQQRQQQPGFGVFCTPPGSPLQSEAAHLIPSPLINIPPLIDLTPPSYPPTLDTLPQELLHLIADDLDPSSAISFARAHRDFAIPAERSIWSSLDLGYIRPGVHGTRIQGSWSVWPPAIETERRRLEMRIKGMLEHGNARRYRLIENLTLAMVQPSVALLEIPLPNLLILHVIAPFPHGTINSEDVFDKRIGQTRLDLGYASLGLHYPSLTYVHFDFGTLQSIEFFPLLFRLAPNIVYLHFDIDQEKSTSDIFACRYDAARLFTTRTKLCNLSFFYIPPEAQITFDKHPFHVVLSLLRHSPQMQAVSIMTSVPDRPISFRRAVLSVIGGYKELTDFQWPEGDIGEDYGRGAFPSLVRLAIDHSHWTIPTRPLPSMPSLEAIYCDVSSRKYTSPARVNFQLFPYHTSAIQPFDPSLALLVRQHPRLRNFHFFSKPVVDAFPYFDDTREAEAETGFVKSIRHGDSEILYMEMLVQCIEVSNPPKWRIQEGMRSGVIPDHSMAIQRVIWGEEDGVDEDRRFAYRKAAPTWMIMTDLDGVIVPAEILHRMREVDGASMEDWQGRNIPVGDDAWAVLERWRAGESEVEKVVYPFIPIVFPPVLPGQLLAQPAPLFLL